MSNSREKIMKFQQQPHTLLMIRPKRFGFNPETESSNSFQLNDDLSGDLALVEFDKMIDVLASHEIPVEVLDDTAEPVKPDAVFPNNWISLHEDGKIILYPMLAENRRRERRPEIVEHLKLKFAVDTIVDLSGEEDKDRYLEGTGSIVFDHANSIAYACRSPRTNEKLVNELCMKLDYTSIIFDALDESSKPIYHTNVMMSVAGKFAVVCIDSIKKDEDQELVLGRLSETGHKIISISYEQMRSFAGNIIEVKSQDGENVVLMSDTALSSLLPGQVDAITQFSEVLPISIPTIERLGGGGVRCMVAGIHLPRRK
jgi:hypothetical protein